MERTEVAIIVIVAAALVSGIGYSAYWSAQSVGELVFKYPESEIITEPRITQQQAIEIVSNDLKNRYPGFEDSDLILFASGKPQSVKEFLESGSQLPLIYYHPNGTQFFIDSNTHAIKNACPPDKCPPPFEGVATNKLAYILEIDCPECGFQHYLVDAVAGSVIYKSPDLPPRNQTNQNQTPPSYA